MRYVTILGLLMTMLAVCAVGQTIDPNVGFCPVPATQASCTTATGLGGHTIGVGTTSFGMWSNGAQDSNSPWYLLLAIPEATDGALSDVFPTITSNVFTLQSTTDAGDFLQTTTGDIYAFAGANVGNLKGDNSMSAVNMFCDGAAIPCTSSNEISAFGSLPNDFEIVVYKWSPGFNGNTAYSFTTSGLSAGTYLAAVGVGGDKNNIQFSTPFTTTGLVGGPVPDGGVTLMLLGGALLGIESLRRKFRV